MNFPFLIAGIYWHYNCIPQRGAAWFRHHSLSSPNSYFGSHNRENYYFCTIVLVLHRTSGQIGVIFPAHIAGIYVSMSLGWILISGVVSGAVSGGFTWGQNGKWNILQPFSDKLLPYNISYSDNRFRHVHRALICSSCRESPLAYSALQLGPAWT